MSKLYLCGLQSDILFFIVKPVTFQKNYKLSNIVNKTKDRILDKLA